MRSRRRGEDSVGIAAVAECARPRAQQVTYAWRFGNFTGFGTVHLAVAGDGHTPGLPSFQSHPRRIRAELWALAARRQTLRWGQLDSA